MKILHKTSLIATVEAFNEALLFDRPWESEAEALVAWVGSRLDQPGAYAGSFALTEPDWDREFRLFTGEKVTTRAARSHIIAEEAMRMLVLIRARTGIEADACRVSEEQLAARIFSGPYDAMAHGGMYCCGKCSIAFWRCLAAGGMAGHEDALELGLKTLTSSRDDRGGWRRFPFHYTLLLLTELPSDAARPELEYCADRRARSRRRQTGGPDRWSHRRRRIMDRAGEGPGHD